MHTDGYVALVGRSAASQDYRNRSCQSRLWRLPFDLARLFLRDRRLEARVRRPLIVGDRL